MSGSMPLNQPLRTCPALSHISTTSALVIWLTLPSRACSVITQWWLSGWALNRHPAEAGLWEEGWTRSAQSTEYSRRLWIGGTDIWCLLTHSSRPSFSPMSKKSFLNSLVECLQTEMCRMCTAGEGCTPSSSSFVGLPFPLVSMWKPPYH